MDSLTHTLVGAALAKTRLGRAARCAPLGLVLGANLPDFENLVLAFADKPTNMIQHRSITHALLGVAVLIPLWAMLLHALSRRFPGRGPPSRLRPLLLGTALAVGSHPLLDWMNTYGIRPWLPFDETWYHGDLVFIIDPWIWLLLFGATCLAGPRSRGGGWVLAALGAALTVLLWWTEPMTVPVLPWVWLLGMVLFAVGRHAGFGRRHGDLVVTSAFVLCAGHVGLLAWSGTAAWHQSQPVLAAQIPAGESVRGFTRSPQPANPFRWEIIVETDAAIYRHPVTPFEPPGGLVRLPHGREDPRVRALVDPRAYAAWRRFARHPVARVARHESGQRVYLLDARYGLFPPRDFASFTLDFPP
ncbi:MAG: metal-dependent hydrolase [Phycisphaerales bacterium]|nr:metal-dependent hydrolase [Phycisphaerales bacterium]